MKKQWIYFENPFLNAVRKNFKKAVKISEFHDSRLRSAAAGNPFLTAMYAFYHPLHEALTEAYNQWKASGGIHKGATLSVVQLLHLLSPAKINAWDAQVQAVYAKGSAGYVSIFPKKHKPFTQGSYLERKGAVDALALALNSIVALAATKSDVDAFALMLHNALTTQGGDFGDTDTDSLTVTGASDAAMHGMYADLGLCINNSPVNPLVYEPLYDLETIRHHEQLIYTGELDGNENHVVLIHTFHAADELKLSALETPVQYYLAAKANDAPGTNTIINVAENTDSAITASAFGNLEHRFLHVINNSVLPGHFRVELL